MTAGIELEAGLPLALTVNGAAVAIDIDPRLSLVDVLRDKLRLTGTHVGCDTAQCGACTVLVDGRAVKSCNVLALQLQGARVQTIEGLAPDASNPHPMQTAFTRHHALQCGFCTPGMVMSACELACRKQPLEDAEIREALEGNLCRCTGYHNIVMAVRDGLAGMKALP